MNLLSHTTMELPFDILALLMLSVPALAGICRALAAAFRGETFVTHYRRREYKYFLGFDFDDEPVNWEWVINKNVGAFPYILYGKKGVLSVSCETGTLVLARHDIRFPVSSQFTAKWSGASILSNCINDSLNDERRINSIKFKVCSPRDGGIIFKIGLLMRAGAVYDTAITVHNNEKYKYTGYKYAKFLATHPRELVNFATCGLIFPDPALKPQEFHLLDRPESVEFFHGLMG